MQNKNESHLRIDCAKTVSEIEEFIKSKVESLACRGVVLGLSEGLDSALGAYDTIRSLGNPLEKNVPPKKITNFIFPFR